MVGAQTLRAWIDEHGPLNPDEAALVCLMCGSRLLRDHAGRLSWSGADLDAAHIVRDGAGQWAWQREVRTPGGRRRSEGDAVVSLGRLLYFLLAGIDPPTRVGPAVGVRRLRPDVPAALDGVLSSALAGGVRLTTMTDQLRAFLGLHPRRFRLPRSLAWTAALLVALAAALVAGRRPPAGPALDPETGLDPVAVDCSWERSFGLAWMDEQTASAVHAEELQRIEGQRLGFDSALYWWRAAWYVWVKQQANDYLTAEQWGTMAAPRLADLLGPDHPYAVSAAIVHASTLQQRQAWGRAAALASTAWSSHLRHLGLQPPQESSGLAADPRFRHARFDSDRDGDGLADLAEELLGTPPTVAATPRDEVAGRPARTLALPLSPGFLVAHERGVAPKVEGFILRPTQGGHVTPLSAFASVQRGYAERYGWLLTVVADADACVVDLDTGTAPRRLHVAVSRGDGGWDLQAGGATRHLTGPGADLRLAADYDAATRTISWWTSAGETWTTPFDQLPPSGPGPYGLRLAAGEGTKGCRSVAWTLRRAEIAPM